MGHTLRIECHLTFPSIAAGMLGAAVIIEFTRGAIAQAAGVFTILGQRP